MKILITGSRGFIGTHLANALTEMGHEVIHYDLKDGNDILNLKNLKERGKGIDGIVDLAAVQRNITGFYYPFKTIENNIMGLSNVLQLALENNAFLLFSSSKSVYGKPEKVPVKEGDAKNPLNIYSLSKVVSEMIIRDFCKNYKLRAVVVRFSTVFGSEKDILDRVIPTYMYKAIHNIDFIVRDPDRVVDPTFIDDVIPLLVKIFEMLKDREEGFFDDYNIVSMHPVKIREIAEMIIKITSSKSEIVKTLEGRTYDYGNFYGDYSKIKKFFGFKPTSFETAMKIYYKRFLDALKNKVFSKEEIDYMLSYYERLKEKEKISL